MDVKVDFELDLAFIRQGTNKEPVKEAQNLPQLENLLQTSSEIFSYREKVDGQDILMYIYTSGTTGLPSKYF
jgi:acyl-coenzyme A synthetase/AMP-(fatty) acid ligase